MRLNHNARRGISMAETVVSSLLVGLVLVSTIQIVGPMVRASSVHADRLVAANLANELAEEIATKEFTSPLLDDVESMGPAVGETRPTYDDIDDFDGWSSTPPKLSTGAEIVGLNAWTRSVEVDHVLVDDPGTVSGSYTGLKRVTVTVSSGGIKLAEVVSLHAHAADSLGFVVDAGGS